MCKHGSTSLEVITVLLSNVSLNFNMSPFLAFHHPVLQVMDDPEVEWPGKDDPCGVVLP